MIIRGIRNIRKKSIGTLVVLLFLLSFAFTPALLFGNISGWGTRNPSSSTSNYLYKDKTYPFYLDDFYDDTNLYKTYTGTKFQIEAFDGEALEWSGTVLNDTVSPVNNTETHYASPSGDYEATYSFEGDAVGSMPAGWSKSSAVSAEIIAEKDGHNKVLHSTGTTTTWRQIAHSFSYDNFIPAGDYTVEFWAMVAQTNSRIDFYMVSAAVGILFHSDGNLKTSKGTILQSYSINTWYHIRFDVKTDTFTYDVYINNVLEKADELWYYTTPPNNYISAFYIQFRTLDPRELWFDAFGIKTGDYQSTESFDYTTEEGVYYGTHDFRDITTEEGVYYGTYDFRDDTVGDPPDGWTTANTGTCTTTVIESIGGHNKVLKCYDNDSTGQCIIYRYFTQGLDAIVEFWFRFEDNENGNLILYESGTQLAYFHINNNRLYWYNGTYTVLKDPAASDVWYHLRVELDDSANTADVYLDGVQVGDDLVYRFNSVNGANRIYFVSETTATDVFAYYFDAFGVSTDTASHSGLGYKKSWNYPDYDIEPLLDGDFYIATSTFVKCNVSSLYDDHQNVLGFKHDGTAGQYSYMRQNWGVSKASGTIEFWMSVTSGAANIIYVDDTRIVFGLGGNGRFVYYNRTSSTQGNYYSLDTLLHVKCIFNTNGGTDGTYTVYVNGVLECEDAFFYSDEVDLEYIRFQQDGTNSGWVYVDALGYSWDTTSHSGLGYDVGWNVNPYDIEPLLEDFTHYIYLGYGTSVQVLSQLGGHSNVLGLYDNSNPNIADVRYSFALQSYGTVEYWIRTSDPSKGTTYYLGYGGSTLCYIAFSGGKIRALDDTTYIDLISPASSNTWYHIRIDFRASGGDPYMGLAEKEYFVYVDDVKYGSYTFYQQRTYSVSMLRHYSHTTTTGYYSYLDGIGLAWDSGYTIGDNIEAYDPDYEIGMNAYPDNIVMINGWYDQTDNMKVNDDVYSNFTSTHTDGYLHEMPSQWDDFTFTNGSGYYVGELETIDANYSIIRADYDEQEYSEKIFPDSDASPNNWIEGSAAPHWNDVDEDESTLDVNDYIFESLNPDDLETFGLENPSIGSYYIYKIDVRSYGMWACEEEGDWNPELRIYDGTDWSSWQKTTWAEYSQSWETTTWTGLNIGQTDANNLKLQYKAKIGAGMYIHFNQIYACYLRVYWEVIDVDLDVQVDIQVDDEDCRTVEYLKFSHKTNVSATIDLDIWNWDTTTWVEIESVDNSATFADDSFTLGSTSVYVNETFGVRIRFQNFIGTVDFELQLDRLRLDYLTTPAELEFTVTFSFTNYDEDLLAMNVQSWQMTNKSQTIVFSIWNYNTEAYVQISSSSDTTETLKEYNTTSPSNFLSSTGTAKLHWNGTDTLNDFKLQIDYLFIQIFYKLDLVHSKSFDTNGIYRYRWAVIGSIHYTSWVVFEVIDPVPNFHAISEADYPTRWWLQNSTLAPFENFTDDIDPSSAWDLYSVSPEDFNVYIPELGNYLLDNYAFYGSSYESPAQWGDFSFTKGAGNTSGELETNDANYAIVDAGYTLSNEIYSGHIDPDDPDILAEWNEGDAAPHYLKLDEYTAAPDGGNIRESSEDVYDKWNFDSYSIPAGRIITRLDFYCYCKHEVATDSYILFDTSTGIEEAWVLLDSDYSWKSKIVSGLEIGQTEFDDFWLNVEVSHSVTPGWVDIEAVYVKVWTSLKEYSVDYTMTWDVDSPESIENFSYDYRTTYAIDCDLDIYNWDTTAWLELESNTGTGWYTDNYTITDPYISGSDQIKVRFQSALTTTNFDMELDQIALVYNSMYTISKKHNNSIAGYAYMQTNTTESISLNSTDYGTHYNLSSGDYFQIFFQTSSDSLINLILLKDGEVNTTLILSPSENTNFNNQTVKISIVEDLEFDQLKISSTFEDTDYVRIYDIKTYKYTLTGEEVEFYVGSHQDHSIYINPGDYNLGISEGEYNRVNDTWSWTEKYNKNITIGSVDYYHIYQPMEYIQCRLVLFSKADPLSSLPFTDYHININRSLSGAYNNFSLLENLFYADKETYVYIKVYDRFDTLINTFSKLASDFIDLEIEVYSLEIINLMLQKTTIDINYTLYESELASGRWVNFMLSKQYYRIGYYDSNNVYKNFTIYLNYNRVFELNRSQICILVYADQQGNPLVFENYKTYLNGSRIYTNHFYREIGDVVGIEIKDRYDISIKNDTLTVVSGVNEKYVVLTLYSLKVMNQQLCFNHINITRDPNYYESSMYWSKWLVPSEIIEFNLFAGYYKINLSSNENETYSYYSYTLSGDDVLLIGSNNTLYNVLVNIANVNTTIGNQITNVQIDLTNQNSAINNSIINIDIDLGNINSTLGNMLVNLDVDITNVANNISALYTFTNTSFINLGNDINVSFISIENNIISINQSISNLVIGVSNDIYLINGTISTMISQLETNLLLMNVSIDTALFDLSTTVEQIGNNITSNFILLNNTLNLIDTNINDSRIAIINNLMLVNNTISTLIADVYSAVYMINNSIYTAVVDLGTYLSLMNNTIYGNLSIVLEQNEFLTELYQMTMFSELLNWTDIGLNISLLTSQIDVWTLINNYKNQSIEVHLKYQELIEKLTIVANGFRDQWLPIKDVEYNLWSVKDQKYLDEWKEFDVKNKTVDFGFFEADLPPDPEDYVKDYMVIFVMFTLLMVAFVAAVLLRRKAKEIGKTPSKKKERTEAKVYKKSYAFNRQLDLGGE